MNLLDENFPENQCVLLGQWGIHVRQIGRDIAEYGADDAAQIPPPNAWCGWMSMKMRWQFTLAGFYATIRLLRKPSGCKR